MFLKRITSEGLAHHSYFIGINDQAIVIDPKRDIDTYMDLATHQGCKITKVVETHRNEDYAIGSTALQQFTGAEILHGQGLDFDYGTTASDGDGFGIGKYHFQILTTPGHTPESLTLTVADKNFSEKPVFAFVGDSLFVGDTGRTDLWGEKGEAAAALHDSLFGKIIPLGDHVIMLPAHGGGSVCGAGIADRNESTIGYERQFNPKLSCVDKTAFVAMKANETHVQAPYFKRMEEWNQQGNAPIHRVPPPVNPLTLDEFGERIKNNAEVMDLRMPEAFASSHIPFSLNVWRDGIAAYFGWVAPYDKECLLVLPENADVDQITRVLYRIGYDNIGGYLKGGFGSWQNTGKEISNLQTVDSQQVKQLLKKKNTHMIDVRQPDEWEKGTIEGALKIFVGDLPAKAKTLNKEDSYICMCAVGHRGGLAASILAKQGFQNVYNYLGGYKAWKNS